MTYPINTTIKFVTPFVISNQIRPSGVQFERLIGENSTRATCGLETLNKNAFMYVGMYEKRNQTQKQ